MVSLHPRHGQIGKLWHKDKNNNVVCDLTPRHCVMKEEEKGFCGVRMNYGGKLVTVNYGRSVNMTEEVIETEAVFHYKPGSKILSLGNIGCMMNCLFCQNWETSQVRNLDVSLVSEYTPEQIVDTALKRGIEIISWTYNDPVVWHEFVLETARLAKQHGLKNLYKSAFYITEEAAEELCEVIDIFSISLKSLNEQFYKRITKAELKPVLKAIQTIAKHDIHLEVSQLVVTDLNDTEEDARKTAKWILKNLGPDIPLHFVRFHPNYKYMHVERTSVDLLHKAKAVALSEGLKYVYLGNLYEEGVSDTNCPSCGKKIVSRLGMDVKINGIGEDSRCNQCNESIPIIFGGEKNNGKFEKHINSIKKKNNKRTEFFKWEDDVNALHLQSNIDCEEMVVSIKHMPSNQMQDSIIGKKYGLNRILASKSSINDSHVKIEYFASKKDSIVKFGLLDRAHFPLKNSKIGSSYKNKKQRVNIYEG